MRQSRRMPLGIALCSAVALVGITIAISAGGRDVRAATGSSPGQVSGTGTIVDGSLTQTVSVLAGFDGVNAAAGSFSIATSSGGPPPTPSSGTVTCLFITGTAVVLGVLMPGAPDLYGFIFISDGGPTGPDTLEIGDLAPGTYGVDCTVGPFGGAGGTLLTSGDFTVSPGVDLIPADGIVDWLQPSGTAAGSFIDASTTPSTTGSIVSTAGLSVTITDAPFPDGVVVSVGPGPAAPSPEASGVPVASGAPSPQAELFACGQTVLVNADSRITLTCGSLIVNVTTGQATIVLGGGTTLTLVTIPVGGAVEVTDTGGGSFTVENVGTVPVSSLTVDGTTTLILAGEITTADTAHFVGFAQPIDNAPILNRVKAGQVIPIRWRLVDGAGAPITNLSSASITVTTLDCPLGTTEDQVEEVVAGSSGLQNLGNGYYQLKWKSPTTYATLCKTLHLQLGGVTHEHEVHDALFQFTK